MRKKLYVFFAAAIALSGMFQACKKSEDSSLKPVDEVSIAGIEDKYNLLSTDTLKLNPVLNSQQHNSLDEQNYDFYLINMGSTAITMGKSDTLSRKKNVSVILGLKTGQYRMVYKIVDKKTGIFYRKQFLVNMSSKLSSGFLLMSEVNGTARLDMLYKSGTGFGLLNDVLAKTGSALQLKGKPYFVGRLQDPFGAEPNKFFLGTSEGTNRVASETFAYNPSMNIVFEFKGATPSPATFKPSGFYEGTSYSAFIYTDHNVYSSSLFSGFSNAVNNAGSGNVIFPASVQVAPWMDSGYGSEAILFDEQSQTFYNYVDGSLGVTPLPAGTLFDFHIQKKLVYMEYTPYNSGEIFAVLKDNNQDVYRFARFAASYKNIALGAQSSYQIMSVPGIGQANLFAVSPALGYLFYAVEGKLYEYDFGTNQAKLMKDYGSRKISMIKFNRSVNVWQKDAFYDQLMVATYDEGNTSVSGQIDFFKPAAVQGGLEQLSSYSGMGKVVSALYVP